MRNRGSINAIRVAGVVALLAVVAAGGGCKGLLAQTALMFGNDPTKTVPAAYPYLAGKRIVILVWADMETLFYFPNVRFEVAGFVKAAMEPNIRGATYVDPKKVDEYQRMNANWNRQSPAEIGKQFGADRVLMIELSEYTTREPDSPHLYRGHISAQVKAYDTTAPDTQPLYSEEVTVAYPPDRVGDWGTSDTAIRRATMEAFGQAVANLFYDRKVKL